MPESRDRLPRPVDVTAMFGRRRLSVGTGILLDEPEEGPNLFGSPIRTVTVTAERTTTMATGSRGPMAVSASRRGERGSFGTPRFGNGRGRNLYGTQSVGRENTPAGTSRWGRGRSTGTVLPSWYPRTPLRDITAVVRAIERRRARLREIEGQPIESPIPQEQSVLDPSVATSGAQLEHDISMISPNPMIGTPCPPPVGKVSKILLGVTNQTAGESDFLTPQKKLLNSIDTVEKVVMEELRKLKRTPSAKKAEREKRVRTLMSMR